MNYKDGLREVLDESTCEVVYGTSPDIGTHGGDFSNSDWYAPGDARNVFGLDVNPKKKKKKKKKKTKFHTYRRAFIESTNLDDIQLECVLFCYNEYRDLANRVADQCNIIHEDCQDVMVLVGSDEQLQHYIEQLHAFVGESFEDNYLAMIGEMNNYQDLFKKPKMQDSDYNQEQLRIGTEIEMEHTTNRHFARMIAKNHLDEDEFYYDKLRKMEQLPKKPNQPE